MNAAGIYRIRVDRGEKPPKFYVGQAAQFDKRQSAHFRDLRRGGHSNKPLQSAFRKYGSDAFSFEILLVCQPQKKILSFYEQEVLDSYAAADVYNVRKECVDSALGVVLSADVRAKMSAARIGKPKPSERRANMSAAQRGRKCSPRAVAINSESHKGLMQSVETKMKRSAALAGRARPQGVRDQISATKKGVSFSLEHRAAISAAQTGRKQSAETIARRVATFAAKRSMQSMAVI